MMHGHEKSDPAIVAMKPANKAEQSAAEFGGAKGRDQGECGPAKQYRTQSRANVSQALERIQGGQRPLRRHTPKVGAVCGKAARTVLCGGRAMKRTSLPLLGWMAPLGHKNIQHTVRYTELSPDRFRHLWR
jgi:hypothetical protein